MRKLLLFLLFEGFMSFSCKCQPIIFRKGYIVEENGDTIYGNIGAKNWQVNPPFIHFFTDSSGSRRREYPGTILGFGFTNGEHFERGLVAFDDVAALAPPGSCCCYLSGSPQYRLVFLRVLIEGPTLNLYEVVDANGYSKFAIRKNGDTNPRSLVTLVGTDVPSIVDYQPPFRTYLFRQQLLRFPLNGNSLQNELVSNIISNSTYSRGSLQYTVSEMNAPCPPTYAYKEEEHKDCSLFFSFGLLNTSFNFQGSEVYLESLHYKLSSVPYFKVGYDFHNAWKHPGLTVRTYVSSWGVNYQGAGVDFDGGNDSYSLRQFTIEPGIGLLWSVIYPGRKTEIFLGSEGGYNISFYKGNNLTNHYGNSSNTNFNYIDLQPKWFNLNVMGGVFLNRRAWEINYFYQVAESFAWDHTYSLLPKSYGITVGYHFKQRRS